MAVRQRYVLCEQGWGYGVWDREARTDVVDGPLVHEDAVDTARMFNEREARRRSPKPAV